jgi:methionine sulfoxide reductase heme-binding subunit
VVTQALLAAAASQGPSWYWYATRGLGLTTLVVLTVTVSLGIMTATRWSGERTPGFVAADLHRNLSLLAICLLAGHIVTTVLDPFAHITVRDVLVPVGAAYRPVWLGLGVVAFWILAGVAATSLLRRRIGPRAWRAIHWAAYASWPVAVVHAMGTGSDARSPWMVSIVASCVAAVLVAVFERVRDGRVITLPLRAAAFTGAVAFAVGLAAWSLSGPLETGWAVRAGTPQVDMAAATPQPVHAGKVGFSDPLVGVIARDKTGAMQIALRDTVDTELVIAVRSPLANETLPVMTVSRGDRKLCSVPASVQLSLYAVCGQTRLIVTIYGSESVIETGGDVTGRLDTSGPLT